MFILLERENTSSACAAAPFFLQVLHFSYFFKKTNNNQKKKNVTQKTCLLSEVWLVLRKTLHVCWFWILFSIRPPWTSCSVLKVYLEEGQATYRSWAIHKREAPGVISSFAHISHWLVKQFNPLNNKKHWFPPAISNEKSGVSSHWLGNHST